MLNIHQFMDFIYLLFYACLELQFLDVETNQSPRRPVPAVLKNLFSNVGGLSKNLSDMTVASSQNDLLLSSQTLGSRVCEDPGSPAGS